jgi:hypothetical protein
LLQRVFGFEVLVCDRCGGRRRILDAVTEINANRRLSLAENFKQFYQNQQGRPGRANESKQSGVPIGGSPSAGAARRVVILARDAA